jgi:alpha-glucosidase
MFPNEPANAPWWERGIIYQVYPRSFQDSDGDGVGDLPGITSRLEYLQWLGVDAVWISPIFPSPMADFGYDVSDYTGIDPLFGTRADFDRLLEEAHARGLKVILDFVPNHSSDQHPWFQESRASRDNPRRTWYLWRDPAPGGGPPNNWLSNFGGSAWTYDEPTGQYYYHAFLPQQPDLNWRNPEVQQAMLQALRFWLERGVDGFRVDALRQIVKDDLLRDNPPNPEYVHGQNPYLSLLPVHTTDLPEVLPIVERMRRTVDAYGARVLIGELYLPIERLVAYYGTDGSGCHLPFNFHLISTEWSAQAVADLIRRYEAALPPGGWPNWVLGNHDQHRIASRVGEAQARVAAMLLLTLRGTPTLYYGDEIGMHDVPIPPERVQDPFEKNVRGVGLGRDPARTPMQWDSRANAGFTTGTPWLPLAADYRTHNVTSERDDPNSLLSLHRRLIHLRRSTPALRAGVYTWVRAQGSVLAYLRRAGGQCYLIALNLGNTGARLDHSTAGIRGRVIVCTDSEREGEFLSGGMDLRGGEGLVVEVAD